MDHNIILFTSSLTQQVIDKGQGGDMVSVWDDDNNEIILNVGVEAYGMGRCNCHYAVNLLFLNLN